MKKVIKKKTVLIMTGLLFSVFVGNVSAAIDRPFNYTITATGTEDSTTYPDQEFTWTVTTTGTETWTEYGFLGSRYVSVYGYKIYKTYYLAPPAGCTITGWDRIYVDSYLGGRDDGTYIDTTNNRLVIKIYSGGYRSCGWFYCKYYSGYYSANYLIYGNTPQTATVTATQSGSGTVNATEGNKFIASFSLDPPPPEHGGTVTIDSRTVTDDNPNVTTTMVIWTTGSVYASTDYSETVTEPWSGEETGSASVNVSEGDKYITTSILVAPNGDTSWSVTDNSDYVDTWMDGNKLYARAINQPPIADPGPDQTVEQDSYAGASVTLDGSGSSDPDGDPLTYSWTWDGGSATGVSPTAVLPLGTTTITLVVNDGTVDSDPDTMTITVVDTTPPTINSISASPDVLWPVNHKMVEVTVTVDCEDICDPVPFCYIVGVSSNEPINGPGDGNTEPDWDYTDDPLVVLLRAERAGGGTGRVYTIHVVCTDASDNTSEPATVDVTVPHDQGKGKGKK